MSLTHGAKVSSSGKLYDAVQYGLDTDTGLIDYDEVERLAMEHQPKMIVAGLVATGLYPLPYADVVTTTTHRPCAARAVA